MSTPAQPPFLGDERRTLVDDLVRAFDEVAESGVPQWWSLEAPPGWGKTRIAQELYARLATDRQPDPHYWPQSLTQVGEGPAIDGEGLRKRVAPDLLSADRQATPPYFWWGVSCLSRPGTEFEALVVDLDQFRRHGPGLERRWAELASRGARLRKRLKGRAGELAETGVGEAVGAAATAANLAVPGLGLLVLVGKWAVQRGVREVQDRRAGEVGPATAGASVVDELAPAMERLGAVGLPLVIVVEDAHAADPTLVELLARLLAAQESRVLLITTSWSGLLDEAHRPSAELLARVPAERTRRFRGGVDLTDLTVDERAALARNALPALDGVSGRLLAERYANPWALQTACRLGAVRRGATRGALSAALVAQLPDDVSGLYRQLWQELPPAVREALTLSVLSAPTSVGGQLTFGEDRWDPALVQAAIEAEGWLREETGPLLADLDRAQDAYSWVRTVEDWLQRFHDPAQRDVALTAARGEYGEEERRALYAALLARHDPAQELSPVQRRHRDRLVLALAAEGFVDTGEESVLGAATRTCETLAASPAVGDQNQVLAVAEFVLAKAGNSTDERLLDLRERRGDALLETGQYGPAVEVYRELLTDRRRVLGAEAPETLATHRRVAVALAESGQLAAAIAECRDLLAEQVRVLGADAEPAFTTRNDLATFLGQSGQVEPAVAEFRRLLADEERVLGPGSPATRATRANFAVWLSRAGEAQAAIDELRALLTDLVRTEGPDADGVLTTRNNFASALARAGQREEAVAEFRQLVADQERVRGADAPDTLTTRLNLAYALGQAGRVDAALAEARALLEDQVRVLGADAPHTLVSRHNVASLLGQSGQHEAAIAEFRRLLTDQERVHGPDSPTSLVARNNLAAALRHSGKTEAAIAELRTMLVDAVRVLGADARETLSARNNLASCLADAGQVQEALAELRRLLADQVRVLGPEAPETFGTRSNIAYWTAGSGEVDAALAQFRELLEDEVRVLGPDAPETFTARSNIAYWTGDSGNAEAALAQFRELLADQERALGPDAPAVVSTRGSIDYWSGVLEQAESLAATIARMVDSGELSLNDVVHPRRAGDGPARPAAHRSRKPTRRPKRSPRRRHR
ncbi:tetratricopeptide repeat protein [Blastococcus sp. SYSU D00669]